MPPPHQHSPAPTPIRAVYGFVSYLLCTAALIAYALWALVPDWILMDKFGITFLPQTYWAVAVPIYLGVAFFSFVAVVYPSLGLCVTPTLDDVRNVIDKSPRNVPTQSMRDNPRRISVGDIAPKDLLDTVLKDK